MKQLINKHCFLDIQYIEPACCMKTSFRSKAFESRLQGSLSRWQYSYHQGRVRYENAQSYDMSNSVPAFDHCPHFFWLRKAYTLTEYAISSAHSAKKIKPLQDLDVDITENVSKFKVPASSFNLLPYTDKL